MASSSFISQSMAASAPLDSLLSRRPCPCPCPSLPPSKLQFTHDSRSLSLTFSRSCFLSSSSRAPHKGFVVSARAEFTTEDPQTFEAASDPESDEPAGGLPFDDSRPAEGPKLYVGNLPWSCNSEEVAEVFQKVGSVEMVEVIYDRESGRSRGFGFVTMTSMEDAEAAVEKLNGADYGGRTLRVNFPDRNRADAPPPRPRFEDNSNKMFVGNIPWGVDDMTLERMFSEHGKVLEAKIVFDRESGRSRGFGFVTMSSASEVNEAINKMDGADVEGRSLRVNLAAARPAARQGDFF